MMTSIWNWIKTTAMLIYAAVTIYILEAWVYFKKDLLPGLFKTIVYAFIFFIALLFITKSHPTFFQCIGLVLAILLVQRMGKD
jgi:hydrogenase-4 membrane subunit HyfE